MEVSIGPCDGTNSKVKEGSRWVTIWSRPPISHKCGDLSDPGRTAACVIDTGTRELLKTADAASSQAMTPIKHTMENER